MNSPLDTVELIHNQEGMAELTAAFFNKLTGHGLSRREALILTQSWLESSIAALVLAPHVEEEDDD